MKFIEITPEEFREYATTSPYKSFMQTPEIAKYRESKGWTSYFFAVKDNTGAILGATMAVAKPTFMGKSTFITPGGPIMDYENSKLVSFFLKHLAEFAKAHNGYVLHISPYYELIERDRDGLPVEGGFNHKQARNHLLSLGFRPLEHPDQPQYLFAMDINGRTSEQILADFKRNTRNHVRKADKMGVTVRELAKPELHLLKNITESTSERRHFTDKPLSYYEQMYDLFVPRNEAKFILAEAVTNEDSRKSNVLTPLSAAMFMLVGDEVVYLFSGSDERYMRDYNAQYAIQWYMIKYAAEHGFKRYNFYGIGTLPDPQSDNYGIYDFKKGFGGQVIELIGSYELPLNAFYYLHQVATKAKGLISSIKHN